MKYLTYFENGKTYAGILSQENKVVDYGDDFADVSDVIALKEEKRAELDKIALENSSQGKNLDEVKILAPILHPAQDIICLGLNYAEHIAESQRYKKVDFKLSGADPVYFGKRVSTASAWNDEIPSYNNLIDTLDYESELAVIIGRDCKNVAEEEVQDYIFGYCVINDVTARELQKKHTQWYLGKSCDGFFPMSKYIITKDEVDFEKGLDIKSYVNGELRQNSNTSLMIHTIPKVIAELSQYICLKAGTIISTGTPSGVGMGMTPPTFLKVGDTVRCEVEGVGFTENIVVE